MAMSRLSMTITAPIVLIPALAIGLTVFLNVGKLDRTLGELEDSRLRFTVNVLRQNLETGLDLGLPVRGLGNAQAAIDFEALQDPDIVAIIVRDDKGRLTAHKAQQILRQRMAPAAIPIETLARFTYLVNMPVAARLELYPPLKVLNYAELLK